MIVIQHVIHVMEAQVKIVLNVKMVDISYLMNV